jgi:hypothetical protein
MDWMAMIMWQTTGVEKIIHILQEKLIPKRIEFKGSVLHLETVDIFSDVDTSVFSDEAVENYHSEIILTLSAEIAAVLHRKPRVYIFG